MRGYYGHQPLQSVNPYGYYAPIVGQEAPPSDWKQTAVKALGIAGGLGMIGLALTELTGQSAPSGLRKVATAATLGFFGAQTLLSASSR